MPYILEKLFIMFNGSTSSKNGPGYVIFCFYVGLVPYLSVKQLSKKVSLFPNDYSLVNYAHEISTKSKILKWLQFFQRVPKNNFKLLDLITNMVNIDYVSVLC